jgi:phosphatidate cytidylyltransferase
LAGSPRVPGRSAMVAEPARLSNARKASAGNSDLLRRVLSALVLAPAAILVTWLPEKYPWLGVGFGLFWLMASLAVWWEWNALVSGPGNRLLFALGGAALLLSTALIILVFIPDIGAARTRTPILIILLGALAVGVFARADRRIWASGGLLYAGALLIAPIILRRDQGLGFAAILFLFALVWATDIAGYFAGRAIGGPKLASKISPNKTWSGAVGGLIGAVTAGVLVAKFFALNNLVAIGVVAFGLSAVAQVGDLFESAIKRRFGAKDTGKLIPGHGGVMDRLDGFLAAALVAAAIGIMRASPGSAAHGLLLW